VLLVVWCSSSDFRWFRNVVAALKKGVVVQGINMGFHIRVCWFQIRRQVAEARESNTMVREPFGPASTM
jgi:hypothetical protein